MGPCKHCGEWHCNCLKSAANWLELLRRHDEHQFHTRLISARYDPEFQRFKASLLGDKQ